MSVRNRTPHYFFDFRLFLLVNLTLPREINENQNPEDATDASKKELFLGLIDEYNELKKEIPNLEFFECKDFLEMAQIINSSKVFIGNLSFGYTLAEGLKKPRLLESGPDFPLVYPNGKDAYDFYFKDDYIIREWAYRKSNQEESNLVSTWEDYVEMQGLQLAKQHNRPEGGTNLYFTGLTVSKE